MVFLPGDHYLWDFWLVSPGEWRDQQDLYHLFYLRAPRQLDDPHQRHSVAIVGHATSPDLRHWVQGESVLEAGSPGSWDDRAIWTGSVTVRDGVAYLFYTALGRAEQAPIQRIGLAYSDDLIHWQRHPGNPLLEVDVRWYEPQSTLQWVTQAWRDPCVIYTPDERIYYMFLTARVNTGAYDGRAVIGLARSVDLFSWEVLPPVSTPGDFSEMEVPQVVCLNNRYYLFFCAARHATARLAALDGRGWIGTHYLVSDKLTGPYHLLTDEPLVADPAGTYYAGKVVLDNTGTPVFLAWRQWDEAGKFCGGLSDPARVSILPDGRLQIDRQQLWTTLPS